MQQREQMRIVDKNGQYGTIDVTAPPPYDGRGAQVLVRLENGEQVVIPTDVLVERADGSYFLPLNLAELESPQQINSGEGTNGNQNRESVVVPVVAEELSLQKRVVETGRVRITKRVREREELVDEPLMQEEVNIERIAVNRLVDGPVPIRYVGDMMIVPLLEEVLVVEKRLMLKEELHVTKRQTETRRPQRVTLRAEEATIERVGEQQQQEVDGEGLSQVALPRQ